MMQGNGGAGAGAGAGAPPATGLRPKAMAGGDKQKVRAKLPSPKEMVAHYESKGMQPQEASLKVIDDLQNLLLRVISAKKTNDVNSHLLRIESKLDSKPGYPQTLAIGVASGAVFHVLPRVAAAVANVWNSVRSATSSK
ncbi:uncharacterized protein LOC143629852 [Bidens hawaiensis]|uniref:uncharacterized protein LOC143629852 n=1 Tax=Bidens hawaiensis TaxID=980011 RepID=UPI00404B8AD9